VPGVAAAGRRARDQARGGPDRDRPRSRSRRCGPHGARLLHRGSWRRSRRRRSRLTRCRRARRIRRGGHRRNRLLLVRLRTSAGAAVARADFRPSRRAARSARRSAGRSALDTGRPLCPFRWPGTAAAGAVTRSGVQVSSNRRSQTRKSCGWNSFVRPRAPTPTRRPGRVGRTPSPSWSPSPGNHKRACALFGFPTSYQRQPNAHLCAVRVVGSQGSGGSSGANTPSGTPACEDVGRPGARLHDEATHDGGPHMTKRAAVRNALPLRAGA
jgi:hypothetical protein